MLYPPENTKKITSLHGYVVRQHRIELMQAANEDGFYFTANKSKQILSDFLDYLEVELKRPEGRADIGQAQEMLLEIAYLIRSGKARFVATDYRQGLQRLIRIYAAGYARDKTDALLLTAADYADLIEAASVVCPGYDYAEPIRQLVYFMGQLFEKRIRSWVTVYRHIQSMSDSIKAVQSLKKEHFFEINRWATEGVEHLFDIQRDLAKRSTKLIESVAEIDHETLKAQAKMSRGSALEGRKESANIVSLAAHRMRRQLERLDDKKARLESEIESTAQLIDLIESNILEFEAKLKNVRRSYLVRLAYTAKHTGTAGIVTPHLSLAQ